jgi:hypothetical protein
MNAGRSKKAVWMTDIHLNFLTRPRAGIVALSENVSLLGCESWADGRYGDYSGSGVVLNDYVYTKDLVGLSEYSNHKMMILCGHTHDPFTIRVLPNVAVHVGARFMERPKSKGF